MASIDNIILSSANPFDNIRSINFWHEQQQPEPTVDSIHQEASKLIETTLDQVVQDHRTRTIMLDGNRGSGKTYLLGRIKKAFNHKAFFTYIPPFPQSDHIWRHILRYTVDSLVQVPEQQTDSQLLIWLNDILTALKYRSLKDRIVKDDVFDFLRSDRQKFVKQLKNIYKKAGIYNADNFFGVLHDLIHDPINPEQSELASLACEWLRGDDLSDESLKILKVKRSIETEEAARETLANFGRIAGDTQPIVICFDQLESIAHLPDGSLDLQSLLNVNTKIHGENNNFLIIISILTDTYNQNKHRFDESHKARIDKIVSLKPISLEQAELLYASRLYPLHQQAIPQADSQIYPLTRQYLEISFPGGKTNPGNALLLGRKIFEKYKKWLLTDSNQPFTLDNLTKPKTDNNSEFLAALKLKWREEFTKIQQRITKIRYLSSPELIQMLQEVLTTLQMENVKTPLLSGKKVASYSLSYQLPSKPEQLGVVWTEDSNMTKFFYVMEECRKELEQNSSLTLKLIRAEGLGDSKNKGYKKYVEIFIQSRHHHLTPDLSSVHYLATYYSLIKDAREGDLVIGGETIGSHKLQNIIRELKLLQGCSLLEKLAVFSSSQNSNKDEQSKPKPSIPKKFIEAKEFLLNSITMQQVMGKQQLVRNTNSQFPQVDSATIEALIQQLCQEKEIQIVGSSKSPQSELVCLIPKQ